MYVILFFTTASLFSNQFISEKYAEKAFEKTVGQFHISNTPSWVREVDYEKEDIQENIDATGVAYLLYNTQYNLEKKTHYVREAKKFVSTTILTDACTVPFIFDFKRQNLTIHHVNIIRNGEIIDKLTTTKKKCFYPRSRDNARHLQQVVFYIDNLHVGDIIDIGYSIMGKDTFLTYPFHGHTFDISSLSLYKKIIYDCFVDKDRSISWKTYLFEQDPVCSFHDIYKVYSWEINDYNMEFLTYSDEPTRNLSIVISTSKWNDIAKYFAVLYKEKNHFSPAPPENIIKLVREWGEIYESQEEQILAAIRLVSDDIYYLSIPDEQKEHYLTPYTPNETLEKHYGDCKDKTCLLIALLKLLDVEAYPVLVNSQKTYKDELPNNYFNHVIVNIKYDGKSYFVDPTCSLQGGTLNTYQIYDYGYGLILREDSEDLVPITRNFLSKFQSKATLSIQDGNINWDHITQTCDYEADMLRRMLIPGYVSRKEKKTLSAINNAFPSAELIYTSPLQIEDDRHTNVITKKFSISAKNLGRKTSTGVLYDLSLLMTELTFKNGSDTSKGLFLEDYGMRTEIYKTIDIHCDKIPYIEEKRVSYADDNLMYYLTIKKTSDTDIRVVLRQEVFKNYIPANELPYFYKKLEEFSKHLKLQIEMPY